MAEGGLVDEGVSREPVLEDHEAPDMPSFDGVDGTEVPAGGEVLRLRRGGEGGLLKLLVGALDVGVVEERLHDMAESDFVGPTATGLL